MANETEKTTVPVPPAPTDGEQPLPNQTTEIIPVVSVEINCQDENSEGSFEELCRQMQRMSDPAYMHTVTLNQLFEKVFPSRPPIMEGLLYNGTYLIAGAPKVGKSFLVAQIAYHVSTGQPLWGNPVHKGTVLYLALEDDYRRLQERMSRMFDVEGNENLFFSTCAKTLGNGLNEQIENFIREHPDTNLVILDTLQKVREVGGEAYSYANDYEVIGRLKKLADAKGICLLIVHHTRKQQANDSFEMISGTYGLIGAADGAFVLQKEKRTDHTATLEVIGRDQPEQKIYLVRDEAHLTWLFDHAETELWKEPPDPLLEKVAALLTKDTPVWAGRASELVEALQEDIQPNTLTKRLNVKVGVLKDHYRVAYSSKRTRNGSYIQLRRLEPKV